MRLCKWVLIFTTLGWLIGSIIPSALAQGKKTFVAYSMKVAQARVEEAIRKGEDFRKKQPDLFYLGGITKPWAVVLEPCARLAGDADCGMRIDSSISHQRLSAGDSSPSTGKWCCHALISDALNHQIG